MPSVDFGAAQVLQRRRVFSSRDPDETRAFMAAKEFYLDLNPREAGAFDFAAGALYLPNSYVGCVQYGSAVTVRVPAERRRDDYFMHLPIRGNAEITNQRGSAACGPRRAVVSSPAGHVMHSEAGSVRVTVSLTKAAVLAQLAVLMRDAPARALEFSPTIDLKSCDGERIARHVQLAIAELDDPDGAPPSPAILSLYEQLIMTGLLLSQPNSYSGILQRLERSVAPRDVRRAIDYMQAHLDTPVTLADIVTAAGVPGRTLLKHFKDHHGVSPMGFLRGVRLQRAREALLQAGPEESVTAIAMTCGFNHLGRFAQEYRRRFGESPSDTHRRSRA